MGADDQSSGTISCRKCGRYLPAQAQYCDQCDEPQTADSQPPPAGATAETADDPAGNVLSRRTVVVGILGGLAVGVGGFQFLTGDESAGHEKANNPWRNRDIEQRARSGTLSMDTKLSAGQWASVDWTPQKPVTVEYKFDNRTTNRMEVAVIRLDDLSRVTDGEEVSGFSSLYSAGVKPEASAEMPAGDYAVLVVNSDWGDVMPEGEVEGRMRIDAALV